MCVRLTPCLLTPSSQSRHSCLPKCVFLASVPPSLPFTVTDVSSVLSPRSWKAQLSSLNETVQSSKLGGSCCAPWFQDISHLESPESGDRSTSVSDWAFAPQDVTCSPCNFPQKGPARTSDPGQVWKRMRLREREEPLELTCVSVTGFTALFTWAGEGTGWTIVLWDLETQSTQCFLLGKKCIPVDSGGVQQLCLVLTGEDVLPRLEPVLRAAPPLFLSGGGACSHLLSLGFDGENSVLLLVLLSLCLIFS